MMRTALILSVLSGVAMALTLDEAVEAALSARGDVSAARQALESSRWTSRAASAWYLPQVNAVLAYQKNEDVSGITIPGLGELRTGTTYQSQYGLTAALPLFVPQAITGSSLAGVSRDLAVHSLRSTEIRAVQQVIASFYGVLLSEMMLDVSTEALEIAREGYRLAEERYDAGTISRFELLQNQVAYENRKPDSIAAAAGLENACAALAVAIGTGCGAPAVVEGDLTDPFPVHLPATLDEARALMRQNNPDLATAGALRDLGDAGVRHAEAAFGPTIAFQTSLMYQGGADELEEIDRTIYSRNLTHSISVSIPVVRGISDYAGYRGARADRMAANAQAADLERYAELALVQAWNRLTEARQTVSAASATVELANEALGIAVVSYEAGLITRLEMDQAFLAHTQARTNYASALYGMKTAEAGLAAAMGVLTLSGEQE